MKAVSAGKSADFAPGQDDIGVGECAKRGEAIGAVHSCDLMCCSGYSDAAYRWTGDGRNA